jgi:phosphoglycolate phosphatase-like HAD superfamily hydrolase
MSGKPVAVDLDGVVVDLVSMMLPKLSELAGRAVAADDIQVFDIGQALGLSDAAVEELWDWLERERAYARAPPIDGAVSVLRGLGQDRVCFMTSRLESLRDQTVEWLEGHGLGGYRLEMRRTTGPAPPKPIEVGHFHALIEDNPTHLTSLSSRVELILLYDQPRTLTTFGSAGAVRFHGWS